MLISFLEFSDYQFFDSRITTNDFSFEWSSKGVKVSIDTSMTELKPVVMENYEFGYRERSKLLALFGLSRF